MRHTLLTLLTAFVVLIIGLPGAWGARFPAVVDSADPFNTESVHIVGAGTEDRCGYAVTAGDINGDGRQDIVIGAYNGYNGRGICYVVFGSATMFDTPLIDLNSLPPGTLRILGSSLLDATGNSIAVGKINGDAYYDIIIGARQADPSGRVDAGTVYVVFGSATIATAGTIDLGASPSGVVKIYGAAAGDNAGFSVAAGKINGDVYEDVIIGAYKADPRGRTDAGATYVVFGSSTFSSTAVRDLSVMTSGVIKIYGAAAGDLLGYSLARGNINGDSYNDIVIGAYNADETRGGAYLLRGAAGIDTTGVYDVSLNPAGLVSFKAEEAGDHAGASVIMGDFNGDAYDDIAIGIPGAEALWGPGAGEIHVVFGSGTFQSSGAYQLGLSATDRIIYGEQYDATGSAVAAGDLNGDGYQELIIGTESGPQNAGITYIVPGASNFKTAGNIVLSANPPTVSEIYGAAAGDLFGTALTTASADSSVYKDLVVGEYGADPYGRMNAGGVYIFRGFRKTRAIRVIPGAGTYSVHDTDIRVFFNSDINSLTMVVSESTIGVIAGSLYRSVSSATFRPSVPFTPGSIVTVTVNGFNVDGEAIAQKQWSFNIMTDEIPPQIRSHIPIENKTNVSARANIVITFSGDTYPDSTTVSVTGAGNRTISMTKSWSDSILTLVNSNSFTLSETITVWVNTGDRYGLHAPEHTWSFIVRPEMIPPSFTVTVPGNPQYLPRDAYIRLTFPSDVDKTSVQTVLQGSQSGIPPGAWSWADTIYTFLPSQGYRLSEGLLLRVTAADIHENTVSDSLITFFIKPEETPPTILSRSPSPNAVNVPLTQNIVIQFDSDVYQATTAVVASNIRGQLSMPSSLAGSTLTFTNSGLFQANEVLTVYIVAKDRYDNIVRDKWSFATGSQMAPVTYSSVRTPATPGLVGKNEPVSIEYLPMINKSTVSAQVNGSQSGRVIGTWSWSGYRYSFTPTNDYAPGETLTLTATAWDIFTYQAAQTTATITVKQDETPPSIVTRSPAAGAVNVHPAENIVITFSGDALPDSTTASATGEGGRSIALTRSWSGSTLTLRNAATYRARETVTVTVSAGDQYANHMTETWSFITRPDTIPPEFDVVIPGSHGLLAQHDTVSLVFPADIDKQSVTATFTRPADGEVSGAWSWSATTYTFTPVAYQPGEALTLAVNASDIYGNALPETVHTFQVKLDEIPPSIQSYTPAAGAVNVSAAEPVVIRFSADILPDSTSVTVRGSDQGSVSVDRSWNGAVLTLLHDTLFRYGDTITVTVTASDTWDNRATTSWSFTIREDFEPPLFEVLIPAVSDPISCNSLISLAFPADVDTGSVSVAVRGSSSGTINGDRVWAGTTYTFTPSGLYRQGETVTITVNATDIYDNSIPETIRTFTVGEHNPWLAVTSTGLTGPGETTYRITYESNDPDGSYTITRGWQYSLDGFTWYDIPENMITGNALRPSGLYQLTWRPGDEFAGVYSAACRFRMELFDGNYSSEYRQSPPFLIDRNIAPAVTVTQVTPDYDTGRITIGYRITDTENNPVSLSFSYSYDNGTTWLDGQPDTSLSGLTSAQYTGSFGWYYSTGLTTGVDYFAFLARLTPADFKTGSPGVSGMVNIDLNQPPSVTLADLYTPWSGDVTIAYSISDAESDTVRFVCSYSIDGGSTWFETSHVGGAGNIVASTGSIVWYSKLDVPAVQSIRVMFRAVPWDHDEGTGDATAPFQLFNNGPPSVTVSLPDTVGNRVAIPYTITDPENDTVTLHIAFSREGIMWIPAAVEGDTLGLGIDSYTGSLVWKSTEDLGPGFHPEIRLRIAATDSLNSLGSSAIVSPQRLLALDNEPPFITFAHGYAGSDTVYMAFNEPPGDGALDPALYTLSHTLNVREVVHDAVPLRYRLLLAEGQELPLDTITVTTRGLPDIFGNLSGELSVTFESDDGNVNPAVFIEELPAVVSGYVSLTYHITDHEGDAVTLTVEYSLDGGETWHAATITGQISDLTSEIYNGTVTWLSDIDLPGADLDAVILKVTGRDAQVGVPALSAPFTVHNNAPPEAAAVSVADPDSVYSGMVEIRYDLTDAESDTLSLEAMYSTDGGETYLPAAVSGQTIGITEASYGGSLLWDTESDLVDYFGRVLFRLTPSDHNPGAAEILPLWIDNFGVARIKITLPEGEQTHNIVVNYQITSPVDNPVSLTALFSTDGGLSWNNASLAGITSGITSERYRASFIWICSQDLAGFEGAAQLKVIPDNGIEGLFDIEDIYLDFNEPPVIAISPPAGELSGDITISYTVTDAENDTVSVRLFYIANGSEQWSEASVSGTVTGIPSDGRTSVIVWHSMEDLPGADSDAVRLRMTATDFDEAWGDETGNIMVDNNLTPAVTLSIDRPDSVYIDFVDIRHLLSDTEGDTLGFTVSYSFDGGGSYHSATISGALTGITPEGYTSVVRWEIAADLPEQFGEAIVRFAPFDNDPGSPDSIRVRFNSLGVCSVALTVPAEEQMGDIPVYYVITDEKSHAVSLSVMFSVNGGTIWFPALPDTALEGITPDRYTGSFVWTAEQSLKGYEGSVLIRVVPDNGIEGIPASDTLVVDYNEPPSVTDVYTATSGLYTGPVTISFRVRDAENDTVAVSLEYSTNSGESFAPATVSGNTGIIPGVISRLTWSSTVDIGVVNERSVYLRLTPADGDPGGPFTAGPFTITNLAGDFTGDFIIDGSDLPFFIDVWRNQDITRELGPATGTIPDLTVTPDGVVDFEDLAVFIQMWNWYTEQAAEKNIAVSKPAWYSGTDAGEEHLLTAVPDGRGGISLACALNIDYIHLIIELADGGTLEIEVDNDRKIEEGAADVFLTRMYQNKACEISAAFFNGRQKAMNTSPEFASLRFVRSDSDIRIGYRMRMSGDGEYRAGNLIVPADELFTVPTAYALMQNSPNPFNPSTTIKYSLPADTHVILTVFNILGQQVTVLRNEMATAGTYTVIWHAAGFPSGVYFYKLEAGGFTSTRKMLLMK